MLRPHGARARAEVALVLRLAATDCPRIDADSISAADLERAVTFAVSRARWRDILLARRAIRGALDAGALKRGTATGADGVPRPAYRIAATT